jgi:hypothetical protein
MLPRSKPIPVPEIAVNKNDDPRPDEDNVRFPRKVFDMFAKSQSLLMKLRPKAALDAGILPPYARHAITALLRSEVVRHTSAPLSSLFGPPAYLSVAG